MRKAKWMPVVVSALSLSLLLAGCGETTPVTVDNSSSNESSSDAQKDNSSSTDTSATDSSSADAATVSEQVLYDANDIKITTTGLEDGLFGTDLKLKIENNSATNVTVQDRNANVNGYMVDTMMSVDVAAGKMANDTLTFQTQGLKECGIESIASMEFQFVILNTDSFDEIAVSDMLKVDTSIAATYQQPVDDSGEVYAETNGVRIIGKGLSTDDSFWGPGVKIYIENNSDQNITVQVDNVSINGIMSDSSMSQDVLVGKKAITAVQFFDSDLQDNGITEIKDVELNFHVFNMESYDDIFDSDTIHMQF